MSSVTAQVSLAQVVRFAVPVIAKQRVKLFVDYDVAWIGTLVPSVLVSSVFSILISSTPLA